VFVVHGRNAALRAEVARTLEALGLEPLILSEQTNEGRTLIEKFEANAIEVGFAVVVLSADDRGVGPDGTEIPEYPNRARQNVILELGYFMGQLGRARVVPLYEPGVELPSDLHGLGYVAVDEAGAWRYRLGRELQAAEYDVDLNRLK